MQPYDYSSQVQVPGITDSYLKGVNLGIARDNALLAQQQKQLAIQAAQQEQQRQQFLTEFVQKQNPSGSDYAKLILMDPKNSAAIKRSFDAASQGQKEAAFTQGSELFSAINSGNNEVAKNLLDTRIEAATNAGDQSTANQLQTLKGVYEQNPQTAKVMLASLLHGIDSDRATKIIDSANKLALAPIEQRKAEAEATKSETEAKYIDRQQLADLEQKGWNTKKLAAEIENYKESRRLEAMKIAISKEDNALKRQELGLKIQKQTQDLQDQAREKVAAVQSGSSAIDNQLNTIDRLLQNPSLDSVVGSIQGRVPAFISDEANDAIRLLETVGSQSFLSMVPTLKGTGSLSNAEGEKLQSALTNLSRVQSESQLRYNLKDAQRLLLKARKTLETKYGAPAGAPDTPAVNPSGADIDALLKKYGG